MRGRGWWVCDGSHGKRRERLTTEDAEENGRHGGKRAGSLQPTVNSM
jgi:hypothetical protein